MYEKYCVGIFVTRLDAPCFGQLSEEQQAQARRMFEYNKAEINRLLIRVEDNGIGISTAIKEKIFQPFFTTKAPGEGTGLGLSLAYDIVTNGLRGELKVETTNGSGTTFIIRFPS